MRLIRWIRNLFAPNPQPAPVPVQPPADTVKPPVCMVDEVCDDHIPVNDDDFTPLAYRAEYVELWTTMRYPVLRSGSNGSMQAGAIAWSVNFINRHKTRYVGASQLWLERFGSVVPWEIWGVLHLREAGGYPDPFARNLMNGQPLRMVTTMVPAGYGPWATWEESAIDAFRIKQVPKVWTIANALYFCERYNGMGYRTVSRAKVVGFSPYIWAFSQHYKTGYFVADGPKGWRDTAIAKGVGVAVLLKELGFQGE